MAKRSIIFVCWGNTCRSAMAEALARAIIGGSIRADSAGLETGDGNHAARDAVVAMQESGLDISNHRTTSIDSVNLSAYDEVVAMAPCIADILLKRYGVAEPQLVVFDTPDPYCRGIDEYRRAIESIASQIRSHFLEEGG